VVLFLTGCRDSTDGTIKGSVQSDENTTTITISTDQLKMSAEALLNNDIGNIASVQSVSLGIISSPLLANNDSLTLPCNNDGNVVVTKDSGNFVITFTGCEINSHYLDGELLVELDNLNSCQMYEKTAYTVLNDFTFDSTLYKKDSKVIIDNIFNSDCNITNMNLIESLKFEKDSNKFTLSDTEVNVTLNDQNITWVYSGGQIVLDDGTSAVIAETVRPFIAVNGALTSFENKFVFSDGTEGLAKFEDNILELYLDADKDGEYEVTDVIQLN
jgi:hypothetical protein